MRVRLLSLFALCLGPAVVVFGQQAERVSLAVLLDRAGWYLDSFIDEFENVVAEEGYTQDAWTGRCSFMPTGRNSVPLPTSIAEAMRARHRDLRSDYLLVKS